MNLRLPPESRAVRRGTFGAMDALEALHPLVGSRLRVMIGRLNQPTICAFDGVLARAGEVPDGAPDQLLLIVSDETKDSIRGWFAVPDGADATLMPDGAPLSRTTPCASGFSRGPTPKAEFADCTLRPGRRGLPERITASITHSAGR